MRLFPIADSRLDELMQSDTEPSSLDFYGTILETAEGVWVLFHCAEGKDRTGDLAMLLLSLAGVDRNDCIANYEITRENILRKPYYAHDLGNAGPRKKLMGSDPETITITYDFVVQRYGSAEDYFRSCGISDEDIATLRKKVRANA